MFPLLPRSRNLYVLFFLRNLLHIIFIKREKKGGGEILTIRQSHEYLAQKAKLLAALEKDAYNRLISPGLSSAANANIGPSPIFSSSTPTVSALHDSTHPYQDAVAVEDPLTPSLVLNIFLSILITGFSVYWALTSFRTPDFVLFFSKNRDIQSSTPGGTSEPIRVLLSLFAALGVGVAEVVIYAFYLRKVNEARMRERKIKERKEVVGSVEVGGVGGVKEVEVETETKEEIEIWGRGVNGGVRRRVRERWKEKEESKR